MAFLPSLTPDRSAQDVKRTARRETTDKKSGYRISLANINKTTVRSDCDDISRCPSYEEADNSGQRETVSANDRLVVQLAYIRLEIHPN